MSSSDVEFIGYVGGSYDKFYGELSAVTNEDLVDWVLKQVLNQFLSFSNNFIRDSFGSLLCVEIITRSLREGKRYTKIQLRTNI